MASKDVYSLAELAHFAVLSRRAMGRMLTVNGIRVEHQGRRARVRWSALEAAMP